MTLIRTWTYHFTNGIISISASKWLNSRCSLVFTWTSDTSTNTEFQQATPKATQRTTKVVNQLVVASKQNQLSDIFFLKTKSVIIKMIVQMRKWKDYEFHQGFKCQSLLASLLRSTRVQTQMQPSELFSCDCLDQGLFCSTLIISLSWNRWSEGWWIISWLYLYILLFRLLKFTGAHMTTFCLLQAKSSCKCIFHNNLANCERGKGFGRWMYWTTSIRLPAMLMVPSHKFGCNCLAGSAPNQPADLLLRLWDYVKTCTHSLVYWAAASWN